MADERDPHVSKRYRELGAEEPPRALDEAILAASRRPARSWTQRWALPLSLAAVVVLSVTVTLRIQHEQPALESPAQVRPPVAKEAGQKPETKKADQPVPRKEPVPFRPAPRTRAPAVAAPSAEARDEAVAPAARAAREAESGAAGAVVPQAAPQLAPSKLAAETPERELERIARLRRDGRHEEADKALAEFRKRHPDYKIAPEMLERVERR